MRQRPLSLLLALTLLAPALQAEETSSIPTLPVDEASEAAPIEAQQTATEPHAARLASDTTEALLLRLREKTAGCACSCKPSSRRSCRRC